MGRKEQYDGVPPGYARNHAKMFGKDNEIRGSGLVWCPDCGGKTLVLDARRRGGRACRRRICTECQQRFSTYEFTAAELEAESKELRRALGRNLCKMGASLMDEPVHTGADGKEPTHGKA